MPQAQWRGDKAEGQSVRRAQEKTLSQFKNWFSAKKVSRVHIDQCVKSQEKPTDVINHSHQVSVCWTQHWKL